jgi:hypothetical protein
VLHAALHTLTLRLHPTPQPNLRQLTFHAGAPWGKEERRNVLFHAWPADATAMPATAVPVHDFWNESLRQLTFHAGEPWGKKEEKKALQFWALSEAALPAWRCGACGANGLAGEHAECAACGAKRTWPPTIDNPAAASRLLRGGTRR